MHRGWLWARTRVDVAATDTPDRAHKDASGLVRSCRTSAALAAA
jgi:hypothetical protein